MPDYPALRPWTAADGLEARRAQESLGLTQAQLGHLLHKDFGAPAPVGQTTISRYLRGAVARPRHEIVEPLRRFTDDHRIDGTSETDPSPTEASGHAELTSAQQRQVVADLVAVLPHQLEHINEHSIRVVRLLVELAGLPTSALDPGVTDLFRGTDL